MSVLGAAHAVALLDTKQQIMLPQSLEITTSFVVHEQGRWFEDELRFVTEHLCQKDWQVLDIGASFGLYTLALSACVGPSGRITSFEPSPACVRLLQESLKLNGVTNVAVVGLALSDSVGTARLVSQGTPELGVLLSGGANDGSHIDAPADNVLMTTLDAFQEQNEIDYSKIKFVKMDVEGCETKVLNGGGSLFENSSPVVLFEVNNAGQWNGEVVEAFEQRGYGCYRLLPGLAALIPAVPDDMDSYLLNLFAIKPQQVLELEARGLLIRPLPPSVASSSNSAASPGERSQSSPDNGSTVEDELNSCDIGCARRALFEGAGYCRGHVERWSVPAAQKFPATGDGGAPATFLRSRTCDRKMWEFMDLWAIAYDRSAPAAARWTALQRSWLAISAMTEDKHGCSRGRLLTYSRVCIDLGLRTRAVEALIVLIQRGLPPSVAGEGSALASAVMQSDATRQGGSQAAAAEAARSDGDERGNTSRERNAYTGQDEGMDEELAGANIGAQLRNEEQKEEEAKQQARERRERGDREEADQDNTQPWRDVPDGFGSAEQRQSAAAARTARGSPREPASGDAVHPQGKDDQRQQELLWSEPFLPCSSISAGCLLHESMGVERRAAWYEASLLYEAVVQQWFSLGFVQTPESLAQSVCALQRVLGLGFFMEEASRRLATVIERQRQREAAATVTG